MCQFVDQHPNTNHAKLRCNSLNNKEIMGGEGLSFSPSPKPLRPKMPSLDRVKEVLMWDTYSATFNI